MSAECGLRIRRDSGRAAPVLPEPLELAPDFAQRAARDEAVEFLEDFDLLLLAALAKPEEQPLDARPEPRVAMRLEELAEEIRLDVRVARAAERGGQAFQLAVPSAVTLRGLGVIEQPQRRPHAPRRHAQVVHRLRPAPRAHARNLRGQRLQVLQDRLRREPPKILAIAALHAIPLCVPTARLPV